MCSRQAILQSKKGIELILHVQPRARRTEFAGLHGGAIKLRVAAPPVNDAANRAICDFLAVLLSIPRSHVRILSGEKSRTKTIAIDGIGLKEFVSRVPDAARLSR